MRGFLGGGAIVCAICMVLCAAPPDFRGGVTLVKAETTVFDKQTKAPLRNLAREDFVVFDGDQQRAIEYFGDDSGPLDLVLLLDVSGSMREALPKVAVAAHMALENLKDTDRAGVIAFGARYSVVQPLTHDFDSVVSGILRTFVERVGEDTDISQAVRGAAGYVAQDGGQSRRAILIMTDNMQETEIPDSEVERSLFGADAVLDAVLIRGFLPNVHVVHPGVLRFAPVTGGEVIEGRQPGPLLAQMIERIRSRYSIQFRPVDASPARARRIRVELSAEARKKYPNAVVRARGSYYSADSL
jgi:hypothetical protein